MGLAATARRLFRRPPAMPAAAPIDLTWVDPFLENVRPFVFVRTEDAILIKRPNQAQKLNGSGAAILKALLDGQSIHALLDRAGREPGRVRDIALFLLDVRRWLEGTLDEANRTRATEVEPFALPFSRLPILAEVAVTDRCNLRCTFCYAGCGGTGRPPGPGRPAGGGREMSAAEILRVLHKIRHQAKVPSVSFTGGEPTIRPELTELVAGAAGLGLRVNLITNGTRMTPARARALARAGLASAQVSLEGVTADTHERVTGVPGSFRRTVAGVRHLEAAGIHVHTNTTLNRDNLDECPAIPAFVNRVLGLDRFSMNLVIPAGSALRNEGVIVRYAELGPHLEAIQRAADRAGVEFMWYSPTPMCLFNPIPRGLGNKGCSACDGLLSIGANGDVLPCSSFDDPVGNLLADDVGPIWQSPKARRYREKRLAHPWCRACEHFALCHGACPLYWRHLGHDELFAQDGFPPRGREPAAP